MKQEQHDIEIGTETLRATVYIPTDDGPSPRPAVLIVTDLAYESDEQHAEAFRSALVDALTGAGMFVITYSSRANAMILDDFQQVSTNDQIDEASAVFRWLRLQELTNPQALDVIGIGLGATLVAGLLERTNDVHRVVLIAPVTGHTVRTLWMTNGSEPSRASLLPEKIVSTIESIDSIAVLKSSNRPTLLIHGAADSIAPVKTSLTIERSLRENDKPVRLWLVPFADHYFTEPDDRTTSARAVANFLTS
jgi:dipeptidyl aminopeptidase/acylaminoacyl peptidase